MKKAGKKSVIKERIKGKTKIIERELEGGTRKIYSTGIWKGKEVMHGKYAEYYEAMELTYMPKEFSRYRYGLYHGRYLSWHEDGYRAHQGNYKNGKKNGIWKTWNDDGGIESIIHYKDGKKDGRCIEYYGDGGKAKECIYKDSKIVKKIGEWDWDEMKDYKEPRESYFE